MTTENLTASVEAFFNKLLTTTARQSGSSGCDRFDPAAGLLSNARGVARNFLRYFDCYLAAHDFFES